MAGSKKQPASHKLLSKSGISFYNLNLGELSNIFRCGFTKKAYGFTKLRQDFDKTLKPSL
jgi:hypothetical protein